MTYPGIATLYIDNVSLPIINYNISFGDEGKVAEIAVLLSNKDLVNKFSCISMNYYDIRIESDFRIDILEKAIISRMIMKSSSDTALADLLEIVILFRSMKSYTQDMEDLSE